jgi:hypothetical protein
MKTAPPRDVLKDLVQNAESLTRYVFGVQASAQAVTQKPRSRSASGRSPRTGTKASIPSGSDGGRAATGGVACGRKFFGFRRLPRRAASGARFRWRYPFDQLRRKPRSRSCDLTLLTHHPALA